MFNDFLYFTRTERIGILSLAVLVLIFLFAPRFLPDRSQYDPTDFSDLAAKVAVRDSTVGLAIPRPFAAAMPDTPEELRPFDPNKATAQQLQLVGLSDQSVRAWISYLRNDGQFWNWQSVEKFRALSDQERALLRPYLVFSEGATEMNNDIEESQPIVLQPFDPNTVERADLIMMGVPEHVANIWIKFVANGGFFKEASDIKKIYKLSAETAATLIPYVQIAAETSQSNTFVSVTEADVPTSFEQSNNQLRVDINQATAEQWQQLRGVGPYYSQRIIKFRDLLGGFTSVDQVAETYGLPDSVFQAIYLQLRPSPIFRKLAVNQLDVAELAAHPYLSRTEAMNMVRYREEHGFYQQAADLEKLYGLSDETKKNIFPYLSFE